MSKMGIDLTELDFTTPILGLSKYLRHKSDL